MGLNCHRFGNCRCIACGSRDSVLPEYRTGSATDSGKGEPGDSRHVNMEPKQILGVRIESIDFLAGKVILKKTRNGK